LAVNKELNPPRLLLALNERYQIYETEKEACIGAKEKPGLPRVYRICAEIEPDTKNQIPINPPKFILVWHLEVFSGISKLLKEHRNRFVQGGEIKVFIVDQSITCPMQEQKT